MHVLHCWFGDAFAVQPPLTTVNEMTDILAVWFQSLAFKKYGYVLLGPTMPWQMQVAINVLQTVMGREREGERHINTSPGNSSLNCWPELCATIAAMNAAHISTWKAAMLHVAAWLLNACGTCVVGPRANQSGGCPSDRQPLWQQGVRIFLWGCVN